MSLSASSLHVAGQRQPRADRLLVVGKRGLRQRRRRRRRRRFGVLDRGRKKLCAFGKFTLGGANRKRGLHAHLEGRPLRGPRSEPRCVRRERRNGGKRNNEILVTVAHIKRLLRNYADLRCKVAPRPRRA